ncbi:MAG TPA: TerC/Alx family metal homeostasis membrane protein [Bacteroidales bacterium]
MINSELLYFGLFSIVILAILVLDLTVIGRHSHILSLREATIWTGVWVTLALLFYVFIVFHGDKLHNIDNLNDLIGLQKKYAPQLKLDLSSFQHSLDIYRKNMGMEYLSGYFIEYTLSMDNVFVIMIILSGFSVRQKYYKQVLFWGILGAIVLRFLFIFTGAALIQKFEWVLLIFGAFLVFTGVKLFLNRNKDEKIEPQDHWLVKFLSKHARVYPRYFKDHFFIWRKRALYITPLFIVLMVVEVTDVIFATDSIPAIFAVTRDPFLVFFSNIFAIIGLRSLFFLLMRVMNIFHYLNIGISFLLVFVGFKLLFHTWLEEIGFNSVYSLYVILGTLVICILLSVVFPKKEAVE